MHWKDIRIDFEDIGSVDGYDILLVFLPEYLYNKCNSDRI